MTLPKPSMSVHADVTNPGQFFACCGLLELVHRLWPRTEAWFENGCFVIASPEFAGSPADIFVPLLECDVTVADTGLDHKISPVQLGPPIGMRLDWWLRDNGKPNLFKTWAANATSHQMVSKWRAPLEKSLAAISSEPSKVLTVSSWLQGSYGFDSDVGWDALTVGFSLNEHTGLKELPTRPAVELLGAIGLQRFFPVFDPKDQLVEYATWRTPLAASVARLAMLGEVPATTVVKLRTRFTYRGSFKGLSTATIVQGGPHE